MLLCCRSVKHPEHTLLTLIKLESGCQLSHPLLLLQDVGRCIGGATAQVRRRADIIDRLGLPFFI